MQMGVGEGAVRAWETGRRARNPGGRTGAWPAAGRWGGASRWAWLSAGGAGRGGVLSPYLCCARSCVRRQIQQVRGASFNLNFR